MSRLDIILSAALTLSVLLNIGLLVYARSAIIRIISVSEEMGDLQAMVEAFTGHLKAIYDLESFMVIRPFKAFWSMRFPLMSI